MNIGEKIKKLRTEKMMTQAELSGDQVTRNMLSLIEKGKAVPSLQTLLYIASRLNVTAAFLLSDESEEYMLSKYSLMADIKLAFKKKNYRICMDLCAKYGKKADDEIKLIMAESAFCLALEELFSDRVRSSWSYLDDAVLYAGQTVYNSSHITARAMLLLDYLSVLSPSLVADNADMDSFEPESKKSYYLDDSFLRYVYFVSIVKRGGEVFGETGVAAYDRHLECSKFMRNGEYEKAFSMLNDILRIDERLSGVVLFNIFNDLEECCINLGNAKSAGSYALQKVSQLERILS